jgi:ribose transport system ATP-binding protein
VIERMIGAGHQELEESYLGEIALDSRPDAEVLLEARGVSSGRDFRDISFSVRAGEVLGVYGFMGGGQLELARLLFGRTRPDHGTLAMEGRPVRFASTAAARKAGVAFVPENRRAMLFHHEPLFKNASIAILERISRLWLKPRREREIMKVQIDALRIRPPDANALLGMLSGGNQQKVALAKWLTYPPKVLVLSEPTRGMDVGAKDDVMKIVRGLREQGIGVVVVSTEPETVLSLADRILVMKKGTIVREFASETVSKDRLLEVA